MPEEAVADTAPAEKRAPPGRTGGPTKAAQQARQRAKRDPLHGLESDPALDRGPEYKMEGRVEIPKPPYFRFGTDQPSPRRPEHFFQWWCGLTEAQKNKCIVYVYRNYPVIGIKVADKKSPTGFRISAQIDKRSGIDALTSLDDILHHYGSGNYTIRFNKASSDKETSTAVCLCIIQGLRDEQHPPVVDLNTLVIEDPANKPYIEGLRLRGVRVPGVDPLSEEDQMGTAAVSQLVGTVERMIDRNAELSARANQPAREEKKPGADESIVSQALATGMKIISDASNTQSAMLKSAMDKVGEIRSAHEPAPTPTPAPDPLAMLDKVGNLLKTMAPPAASTTQLDTLVKAALDRADKLEDKLFTLQAQQLTFFQSMLQQGQQARSADSPPSKRSPESATPATPSEMLRELVKLKEGLGNLTGDGEHASESSPRSNPNAPWWASLLQNLPQLMQAGAAIASMVAVASYNNAIAKTGAGQPTPVAMPTIQPPAETEPSDELPPPPPSDGAQTNLPQPGDTTLNAYHHFLAQLEKPLLLALENNEPGDQFADKLVGWQGQVAYDLLHGLGRDSIIQIMSTYRPIWSVVSTIPAKFSQFLDEFLSYGDQEQTPDPSPPPSRAPGQVTVGAVSSTGDITEAHVKIHNPRAGKKNPAGPAPQ